MAAKPNLCAVIDFCEKLCLPVITWNKKHSSKQVVSMIYGLRKDFFAAATLEGL